MNIELINALKRIEMEKGLAMETVLDALREALLTAYKKDYGEEVDARVNIDRETGDITVLELQENESGEIEEFEATPDDFGRIAAQTAKQVIIQRIREAERELMFEEYEGREGDIVTGIVQQSDQRYTLIDLGKVEALLPPSEQVRGERYDHGARLKTYIVEVRKSSKGPQIMVSRTHPGLLKRLFELEVPEIFDGLVEIKAVSREAGQRSKVAVVSNDPNVDPVGACVGAKGSRVRMIVSELRGEKVDIVEWKEDSAEFIANAISPAKVREVVIEPERATAEVIVPDNQLSLAIGKEGQNARLAAKMTGWRIDILSESQAMEAATMRAERELLGVEGKQEKRQCRAITGSDRRCRNKALKDSDFCGIPAHQRMAAMIEEGSVQVEEVTPVEVSELETEVSGAGEEEQETVDTDVGEEPDTVGDVSAAEEHGVELEVAPKGEAGGEPREIEDVAEPGIGEEGRKAEIPVADSEVPEDEENEQPPDVPGEGEGPPSREEETSEEPEIRDETGNTERHGG